MQVKRGDFVTVFDVASRDTCNPLINIFLLSLFVSVTVKRPPLLSGGLFLCAGFLVCAFAVRQTAYKPNRKQKKANAALLSCGVPSAAVAVLCRRKGLRDMPHK